MLESHRTMQAPGEGIVRAEGPTTKYSEYPKHMVHPGFQPGKAGEEVKSPHGFSYHVGGQSIRFPPVLVMDEDQEEYHKSQGYESIGKSDPAAFARAVQIATPRAETHIPDEYPKWVPALNRSAESAEQEAELMGGASSEELRPDPAVSAEVNHLMVPIASPSAPPITDTDRMDRLEAKVETIVSGFDKLSAMLAQVIGGRAEEPEPKPPEPPPAKPEDASNVADLRRQLTELGVKPDGRWSAARLMEELDRATTPGLEPGGATEQEDSGS